MPAYKALAQTREQANYNQSLRGSQMAGYAEAKLKSVAFALVVTR